MKNLGLANKITIARILFVPIIIIISISTRLENSLYNYICVAIIILFGIGDIIDGYVARKYDQITKLGTFLDPFADKYMVVSCFMVLTYYGKIPLWYFLVVFNRDLFVFSAWIAFFLRTNEMYTKPNFFGKTSAVLHIIIIFMALMGINHNLLLKIVVVSTVVTLVAGVSYIHDGLKFSKTLRLPEEK